MKKIVTIKFGSHLYGTNTKDSDIDYKGIFIPSEGEVYLGKIPKSINTSTNKKNTKNTRDDIDTELYSLQYFIELACQGQTVALDMLHAPNNKKITTKHEYFSVWNDIRRRRNRFYTKNLKAFVGYAQRQAAKYGIKGSRLNAADDFLRFIDNIPYNDKLATIWGELKEDEHRKFIENSPNGVRQYQICGKILQETMDAGYAYGIVSRFYAVYGARAKKAAQNEGIDWKAVSHAFRAAYQVKELLTRNTITFPRPEAEFLLRVKQGKIDFLSELSPTLEDLIDEVTKLAEESTLPEEVDRKYWDNFIVGVMQEVFGYAMY